MRTNEGTWLAGAGQPGQPEQPLAACAPFCHEHPSGWRWDGRRPPAAPAAVATVMSCRKVAPRGDAKPGSTGQSRRRWSSIFAVTLDVAPRNGKTEWSSHWLVTVLACRIGSRVRHGCIRRGGRCSRGAAEIRAMQRDAAGAERSSERSGKHRTISISPRVALGVALGERRPSWLAGAVASQRRPWLREGLSSWGRRRRGHWLGRRGADGTASLDVHARQTQDSHSVPLSQHRSISARGRSSALHLLSPPICLPPTPSAPSAISRRAPLNAEASCTGTLHRPPPVVGP